MDRIIVNQYSIECPFILDEHRLAFFSDVHGDITKLESIIELLKKLRVSVLLLGGDLIDTNKDDYRNNEIKELLKEISKTTKIFFSIGNHDLVYFQKDSKGKRCEVKSEELDFWKDLNSIKENNIYLPDIPVESPTIDKWSLGDDIDISSINFPIEYYWNKELCSDFDSYLDAISNISINTDRFNILLCHSPKNIIRNGQISSYLNYLKKFNLILSGHMHGGLVPKFMRHQDHGGGIVGPYASILPKHSYGVIEDENTISLTSAGVTKLARSSEAGLITNNSVIGKMIDYVYPPEVELIDLVPGDKTSIKIKKFN